MNRRSRAHQTGDSCGASPIYDRRGKQSRKSRSIAPCHGEYTMQLESSSGRSESQEENEERKTQIKWKANRSAMSQQLPWYIACVIRHAQLRPKALLYKDRRSPGLESLQIVVPVWVADLPAGSRMNQHIIPEIRSVPEDEDHAALERIVMPYLIRLCVLRTRIPFNLICWTILQVHASSVSLPALPLKTLKMTSNKL